MKATILKATAVATTLVSFAACSGGGGGGGGGSTGGGFGSAISAQFIDAPVKGLTFTTSSNSTGKTGSQGKFTCKRGEIVNFSLKGLKLGQAACGEKIFVHDLFAPVGVSGHTWSQAASVIQSFSTGTSELDLTAANSSALDLSSLVYGGGFDTTVGNKVTEAAISGTEHKNIADAATAADLSLVEHGEVDSTFAAFLDGLIAEQGGQFVLKASLSSGTMVSNEEFCSKKVDTLKQVSSSTVSGKKIYTLSTVRAISYDEASEANSDVTCSSVTPTDCKAVEAAMVPNSKIISGPKFDVAAAATINDYLEVPGLNVSSYTVVSLVATAAVDDVKVSGTFYNELTVLAKPSEVPLSVGQKIKCLYKID
ncbi:hypothetical protein [Bdellovibrio bacteriovorus]|uniref:hypothetical protein n=1 Tax=Bdellovibrio bacteriovorus TaxID=959 RepID=UPI0035A6C466